MATKPMFFLIAVSFILGHEMALAMPGRSGGPLFDADAGESFRAQFEELGVSLRIPNPRPPVYRRSLSEPALLVNEANESSPPVRRRRARNKHPSTEHVLESTAQTPADAEPLLIETELDRDEPTRPVRRQKLRRGASHRRLGEANPDDLYDVSTALFASQLDAPLNTFLREPNDAKSRFFQMLREQRFLGHRIGRFGAFHIRFDKILLDAFLKSLVIDDPRQAAEFMGREIQTRLARLKINEDTRTAWHRLLQLTMEKIEDSQLALSLDQRRSFAKRILVNVMWLYLVGPIAVESGEEGSVAQLKAIMATWAFEPTDPVEPDPDDMAHWDAWIEVLDRLLGD